MTTSSPDAIPAISIAALFTGPSSARDDADRAIMAAASEIGFMLVADLPQPTISAEARREMLRIFTLPEAARRPLWRQKFDPARPNVYRGWFPLQDGHPTYKEGIDIGPDLVRGAAAVVPGDPLCEATPLPPEAALPGWRDAAAAYYRDMVATGGALMRSIARSLALPEAIFDAAFAGGGISTLRFIRYPTRPSPPDLAESELWVDHQGERRLMAGRAHADSGFVTLLAQDGVSGLQARARNGAWLDVPPSEGTLAVNFGKVLERWSNGRIKATEHRVLGSGRERFSIPFFYEPRVDAEIAPLPLPGAAPFPPFLYGDHLWAATTKFVEFYGLEHLRPPRRAA